MNTTPDAATRRIKPNRLALKLALVLAGTALALGVAGRLAGLALPGWALFGLAGGMGGAAYVAAHRLLAARLDHAHETLVRIRQHQLDRLVEVPSPRGDELNALLWQVYRTGQVLEKERHEMQRLESYRREFLGNVSHELKTPIFAVRGFAETLLDGALDDTRVNRRFIERIMHNAGRLANLADDLGEISRIESGELKMTMEPFSLRRLVREVVESLEPKAQARAIALRYQAPDDLSLVLADRERIRQVLLNLIDNAVKYNNAGGHVEVVVRGLPAGEVKVSVVDDGIGIAAQHVPRLTERFFRVDKSRSREQGGTGLGLAIVKHILGAHGRHLTIESTPGRGSTFAFTLSAAPEAAAPGRPRAAVASAS